MRKVNVNVQENNLELTSKTNLRVVWF